MIIAMVEQRKWGAAPTFGPRQWLRHRLLLREIFRLEGGEILDAGCGQGRIGQLLSARNFSLFGFDESREGIKAACDNAPGACFLRAGVTRMPFAGNKFDAVVSGDVLEHVEDDKAAVEEIFRVLRPGGLAVVSVPAHPEKWSIDDDWSGHKRRYDKDQLINMFKSKGFETITCYHWGWPITRVYYQWLYLPMLKRRLQNSKNRKEPKGIPPSTTLDFVFRLLFLPDLMLLGAKPGIGIIAVFKKP